ncbi:MAG: hypothetical protein JSU66_01710 [Deltaproteobacteria bacterium]|nr:MAG: hypothetical protein JSU66_01710 [Deltaproteobacteria bacterium]
MSGRPTLRISVVGATGALGREVISVLDERHVAIAELLPIATDRSLGTVIDFQGDSVPVYTEAHDLGDFTFLCAPPDVCREYVRTALERRVPAFDLSGALADVAEVPLVVTDLGTPPAALSGPVVASAAGSALAWALVLAPLERAAGLCRVVGTVLEAVSGHGLRGIESLHDETVALLSQREMPDPSVFPGPVAFDCLPRVGGVDPDGHTGRERALARDVRRLLGENLRVAASVLQVPTFTGDGTLLAVETERELPLSDALAAFEKAPGVALVEGDFGPTTRSTAGSAEVLIGRMRSDPSSPRGLLLWIVADTLRLAAANAVKLAETRFRAN